MKFTKMHSLGNDFVIIDRDSCRNIDAKLIGKIMQRNIGIGCDQLISYSKSGNIYELSIFNKDGTLAGSCGNGIRCVAKLLNQITEETSFKIKVRDHIIEANVENNNIIVNMGTVDFNSTFLPNKGALIDIANSYDINIDDFVCGYIGIKHLVIFNYDRNFDDMQKIGFDLSTKDVFKPEGINVNFAKIIDGEIYLKTFEYGTGFTYACGSGACVTFAIALEKDLVQRKTCAKFELGSLELEMSDGNCVIMKGSATKVADGVFYG